MEKAACAQSHAPLNAHAPPHRGSGRHTRAAHTFRLHVAHLIYVGHLNFESLIVQTAATRVGHMVD